MIPRTLSLRIEKLRSQYPVLAITGPRQSGKTTLARKHFPNHSYLSLENPDLRREAEKDPRGFLADWGTNLILDEIQRVPQLFSYLQEKADLEGHPSRYVLTGSQQFLLMENISQSLAGRILILDLYPFTLEELAGIPERTTWSNLPDEKPELSLPGNPDLDTLMFTGFYPRIHDKRLDPSEWLKAYTRTYLERDVRQVLNIRDLGPFQDLLELCASRIGGILNYSSLSGDVGVSVPTVKHWITAMETSGLIFRLRPYQQNFGKRVTRLPKLYFTDTGLAAVLLGIHNTKELSHHPLRGALFENFVIAELFKRLRHLGEARTLFFWRDKTGHEIDLLLDSGKSPTPFEIKSSRTFHPDFTRTLKYWMRLPGNRVGKGWVVYNGERLAGGDANIRGIPWRRV